MTAVALRRPAGSAIPSPIRVAQLAGIALALAAPLGGNDYQVALAVNLCVTLILTLSLNLVVGHSGQFHLSHAAFFGIGAYGSAILAKLLGVPPWACLPVVILLVGALALLVGVPVTRLRGLYLAVATLAFSLFAEIVVGQGGDVTGGGYGIQGIPTLSIFGLPLRGKLFYPVAALALLLSGWSLSRIMASKVGREIIATRDHADAAAASGIHPAFIRVAGLVLASAFAALAGWVHTFYHLAIDVTLLSPELTFLWFFMVLVGGIGNAKGVVLGTIILTLAPELLGFATGQTILGIGVLMILITLFAPRGLGGLLDSAVARWRKVRP